jgi:WD40 repeat protein
MVPPATIDPIGKTVFFTVSSEIEGEVRSDYFVVPLDELETAKPRRVGGEGAPPGGAVWFDPGGKRVVRARPSETEGQDPILTLWSTEGESEFPLRTFRRGTSYVNTGISLERTGSWMGSAQGNALRAVLWDLSAPPGADPLSLQRGKQMQGVWSFALHPEGKWAAVGDSLTLSLWPLGRRYPHVLSGHGEEQVASVVCDPNGKWVASRSYETLRLWPLSETNGEEPRILLDRGGWGLAASPDGRHLAVGTDDGAVVIPVDGGPTKERTGIEGGVFLWTLAFDPTGRWLAGAGADDVRVWDLQSDQVRALDVEAGGWISIVEFTRDGRLLLVHRPDGSDDFKGTQVLRLWDPETDSSEILVGASDEPDLTNSRWAELKPSGRSKLLSPDGRYLLWPVEDYCFSVYDLEARVRVPRVSDQLGCLEPFIAHPVWHPSGRFLVMGSLDSAVRVIPLDGGEPHLLLGHDGFMQGLDVHPGGEWVASGGRVDGTVRLWPMPRGQPFHTLPHETLLDTLRSLTNHRVVRGSDLVKSISDQVIRSAG